MATTLRKKIARKESALFYGEILGFKCETTPALIKELHKGIKYPAVPKVQKWLDISGAELGRIINVSPRTLSRRKGEGRLRPDESDRLYRITRLIKQAEEVLEGKETAIRWLKAPNYALGGVTPLDFADTEVGGEEISELLGRIEHGVFS
jgi:putative toxin-antitoxin system antitoxin component (TIGR02293 family)